MKAAGEGVARMAMRRGGDILLCSSSSSASSNRCDIPSFNFEFAFPPQEIMDFFSPPPAALPFEVIY